MQIKYELFIGIYLGLEREKIPAFVIKYSCILPYSVHMIKDLMCSGESGTYGVSNNYNNKSVYFGKPEILEFNNEV